MAAEDVNLAASQPRQPFEPPPEADMGGPGRSLWGDAWHRLVRDKGAVACMLVIVLYALVALGTTVYDYASEHGLARWRPTPLAKMVDDTRRYQRPTLFSWTNLRERPWTELLGTDWAGQSTLIRAILGVRVSLTVGLLSNLIAIPLGMVLGALAGYFGRWIDDVIVWLYSTLASIPGIILLIAMKYAFQGVKFMGLDLTGIHGVYIALGITSWIGTCRYVRAEVLKVRELDYVTAARAAGRGELAILLRHVLPNVMHLGIISFSLGFVGAVSAEVILSYLNLGVAVGTPSWGTMINGARMDLDAGIWWELTSAVAAMFFLVLALNILGDRLRDAFDPRLRTL